MHEYTLECTAAEVELPLESETCSLEFSGRIWTDEDWTSRSMLFVATERSFKSKSRIATRDLQHWE